MEDEVTSLPPTPWLACVPLLSYKECLQRLHSFRELPPNRADLFLPEEDCLQKTLEIVGKHVSLKQSHAPYLTVDELSSVVGYTVEDPYPWYKLLSGWMM
eukprot:PhF_6_TR28746/c0_g1_i1/m.42168